MEYPCYYVGVDPGSRNLGLSLVRRDSDTEINLVKSWALDPSKHSDFIEYFDNLLTTEIEQDYIKLECNTCPPIEFVTIERYVPYNNIFTQDAEVIVQIIGKLDLYFNTLMYERNGIMVNNISQVRAIDWKVPIVKALVRKKGFDNPSSNLDKKFSLAAGSAVLSKPQEYATDHEADATCLACLPIYVVQSKK